MFRRLLNFVLHSRIENVMAVAISVALLSFFSATHFFRSFAFGMHDLVFILLPVGILSVKCLIHLLFASGKSAENEASLADFFSGFFQPFLKLFRDWFPFLLLSACYYSLYTNLILRVNPQTSDATLARIDELLFGQPPSVLLQSWIRPWLTDFFNVVYFSFVLYFPGVALFFYLKGEQKAFRRIMMGYLTLVLMGVLSYLLVPAIGPGTFLDARYTHDLRGQMVSHGVDSIMKTWRVSHDCFPSLHVAIPLLLSLYLRAYRKKWFLLSLLYVALMCGATIYLRYHYVIDVIGSFVYAPVALWLNDLLMKHWPGEQQSHDHGADIAEPASVSVSAEKS